jgi:hypothetical protein
MLFAFEVVGGNRERLAGGDKRRETKTVLPNASFCFCESKNTNANPSVANEKETAVSSGSPRR